MKTDKERTVEFLESLGVEFDIDNENEWPILRIWGDQDKVDNYSLRSINFCFNNKDKFLEIVVDD